MTPEITALYVIKSCFEHLKADFKANVRTDTILHKYFRDYYDFGKIKFLEIAENLVMAEEDSPRYLEFRLGYDTDRAKMPSIYITYSSDRRGSANTIGVGEGLMPMYDNRSDETKQKTFTRFFDSAITFTMLSDNAFEASAMSAIVEKCLISIWDRLHFFGFANPNISVTDVNYKNQQIPAGVFVKNIDLTFFRQVDVPTFEKFKIFDGDFATVAKYSTETQTNK